MPENPTISIKYLISVSATPDITRSWMVAGTARGLDSVRVEFTAPWASRPVTAYCRSADDPLPDICRTIDLAEGERIWIARFDIESFGPHTHFSHLLGYLEGAGDAKAIVRAASTADPQANAVYKDFARGDVEFDSCEFDIGVLLVHGIGQYNRGQTLVGFSDPLIKFMQGWYRGFNGRSARDYAGNVDGLRRAVESGPLYNDPAHWGLREELESFVDGAPAPKEAGAALPASGVGAKPLFGNAQVADVVLNPSTTDPGTPASALIRVAVIDEKAIPHEATVLLSEAWWTPSIVPPTRQQLLDWVFRVLPLMVSTHITLPLRRAQRHRLEAKSRISRFVAVCEEWFARLWILLIFGPVSLLLCLATQLLLSVLGGIAALPIPRLRTWLTPVLEWLIGAPGQSYVLVNSPIRRGSIVSDVDRNLDWVCARCRKVIVLAHSQGAVAAHFVLTNKRRERSRDEAVKHLITVGSGIKKLKMLEEEGITQFSSLCVNFIFVYFVLLGLRLWQHDNWGWLASAAYLPSWLDPSNVAWSVLLLFIVSIAFIIYGEEVGRPARAPPGISWTDYYASHDPVPSGPMKSRNIEGLSQFEVNNYASILQDHNSYWDNTEEIVAPVAMAIMRETGLPFQHLTEDDQSCLERAKERRKWRVRTLAWIKVATAVAATTFLSLLLLANWGRLSGGSLAFPTTATVWSTATLYGPMLVDLVWEALPVVIVLVWSWAARWLQWRQIRRDAEALARRGSARTGIPTVLAHLLLALSAAALLIHWWRAGDRGATLLAQWQLGVSRLSEYLDSLRSIPAARFEPSLRFDPTSADWYAKIWEIWTQSIRSPEQFLGPAFAPTWQQFVDALGFYLVMVSLVALISAFIAFFLVSGDFSTRAKSLTYPVLKFFQIAVAAMAIHFPFWLLGGKASFYGTCVAFVYGTAPYLPLISLAGLIMSWSVAPSYRASAIMGAWTAGQNPAQNAMQDAATNKWALLLASLLSVALTSLSLFGMFRALSFVHALGWVPLAAAIILSFIVMGLVETAKRLLGVLLRKAALLEPLEASPAAAH
jgi:hypothetical protein